MYSYDETLKASIEYFSGSEISAKVWLDKYALKNLDGDILEKTPEDTIQRIAKELHRIEQKKYKSPMSYNEIYSLLDKFTTIIPQGSLLFGIGNPYQCVSLSNCYVLDPPVDSYSGILHTDQQLVNIAKRRGGNGISLDNLRPSGSPTQNAAGTSTGIPSWMERFSNSTREVGQSGRRGALMLTLNVHHPDISKFINVKRDKSKVTGSNVSVQYTDEFLTAIENKQTYQQRWPINNPSITKNVDALDIWDQAVAAAWDNAEPGLQFWDNVLRESIPDCYAKFGFKTITSNPCSELLLSALDSCRLIALNLMSCVKNPFTNDAYFDFDLLRELAGKTQRFIENVIDLELECIDRIIKKIEQDPEPDNIKMPEIQMWKTIRRNCELGRRTGSGYTALGDVMASLGITYGSQESIQFTDKLNLNFKLGCYRESVNIAKEIGPFPIYDFELEKDCPFIQRIKNEDKALWTDMKRYGRRNIALLTVAPTGSISMLAGYKIGKKYYHNTTSGIEPCFMTSYTRRKKINHNDEVSHVDFVDNLGDRWINFKVYHSGVQAFMDVTGKTEENSPYYNSTSDKIDWINRVKIQGAAQRHIDHSISSCLKGDTSLIQTCDGLYKIEELCKNIPEKTFKLINNKESINTDNQKAKITEGYNNGISDVLRFKTVLGKEIECTPNHRLMVLQEDYSIAWKRASEISTGDFLVSRKGLNLFHNDIRTRKLVDLYGEFKYDINTNNKDITIPKIMSKELGRFLGYMCSDAISLCQIDNNIEEDWRFLIENIFGLKCSNSRKLVEFCKWIGLTNHDTIEVPLCVRTSTKSVIKEFIRGVTLDGHVGTDRICVMASVSKKILQQIQSLLLNFGIEAGIYYNKTKESWDLLICNDSDIYKFISLIGFAEERKQSECCSKYKRSSRIKITGDIPNFGLREKFRKEILPKIKSNRLYNFFHSMNCKSKDKFNLSRESVQEMVDVGLVVPKILLDDTYVFSKVTDIDILTNVKTYDLSVPDKNSYIANGFISHNTINLPSDVDKETVDKIFMTAWKENLKGITVYRDGCRDGVLVNEEKGLKKNDAPKRPKTLPCDVHHISIKGKQHYVLVGLYYGDPYEVFCGAGKYIDKQIKTGTITKRNRRQYRADFDNGDQLTPLSHSATPEEDTITRLINSNLRHGVDISFIVHQLEKAEGDIQSFSKALARALKKYIKDGTKVSGEECPQCGTPSLIRKEGCIICNDCGWSKC